MPAIVILKVGTQFTYEHYPLIQLITSVYAYRNPNNGVWSTRISTNTGTDSLLDDFVRDMEVGHPTAGKLFVLNSEYAAKCLHELFKDFPWFVSVGIESLGVDKSDLILYVTDPAQVATVDLRGAKWKPVQDFGDCTTNYLFYDRADNTYVVRIVKMDHPIPAGA